MEQFRIKGASYLAELTRRCIEAAKGQGISEAGMQAEVRDIADYIRGKLKAANTAESDRRTPQ